MLDADAAHVAQTLVILCAVFSEYLCIDEKRRGVYVVYACVISFCMLVDTPYVFDGFGLAIIAHKLANWDYEQHGN